MTDPFAPASDHARALKVAASTKAATTKFAKGLSDGKQDMFRLNPFLIKVVDGFNSRDFDLPENEEHVADLARSIAAKECRLRAIIRAINDGSAPDLKTVPVILSPKGQNDADLVASQFTSNAGKPFNELEASRGIKRLLAFDWSEKDIAARTGLSSAKVARLIRVLEMGEEIKGMVAKGEVSVTQALSTISEEGTSAKALEALRKGQERATEAGAKKVTARHVKPASGPSPATVLAELRAAYRQAEIERQSDGTVACILTEAGAEVLQRHLGR